MEEKYYQFDVLKDKKELIHFYSKIPYNFARKYVGDEEWNREIDEIRKDFNYEFKTIKYMKQVHSANVKIVNEKNVMDEYYPDCDGMITNLKDVALITHTADCQAILLYDEVNGVIGNIHSGWKGTSQKIIVKAIRMMIEEYGSNPENIIACINPSIMQCCFEVEDDVVDIYKEQFADVDKYIKVGDIINEKQKYYIDTIGINVREMINIGLKKENIYVSGICTKCNCDVFHSYRVEGIGTGQNLALIVMKS